MYKYSCLTTSGLTSQEPGTVVSRFVGDADTVENLFTSGIVSMFADACKIISIVAVIWFKNKGLAIVLLVLLPFLFIFRKICWKRRLRTEEL
jgi:ATP-binding cassette subfamily B protein